MNGEEVFSYKHDDTDYTWSEPGPDDPLSLIDQVYLTKKRWQFKM